MTADFIFISPTNSEKTNLFNVIFNTPAIDIHGFKEIAQDNNWVFINLRIRGFLILQKNEIRFLVGFFSADIFNWVPFPLFWKLFFKIQTLTRQTFLLNGPHARDFYQRLKFEYIGEMDEERSRKKSQPKKQRTNY